MRSASGSKASRVCMGLLVNRSESLARLRNGFIHVHRRGAAGDVVDGQNIFQRDELIEVLLEVRIQLLQVREFQALQFALLVEGKAHGLTDNFMSNSERYALAHEVSRRGE